MSLLSDEQAQKIFQSEHCNISKDLAGILYRAIEAAVLDARPTDQRLLNLLCRIHRDGGHYIAEHGLDKAVEDADIRVAEQNAALDAQGKQDADNFHRAERIVSEWPEWKRNYRVAPVAEKVRYGSLVFLDGYHDLPDGTKLYAAPVVQPDMVKDAERYRWLRDESQVSDWDKLNEAPYPNWDDIIDAMIAAAEGKG